MAKRYLEFYAKVIIEEFFNLCLEVKDKPDLQSEKENIGIELTSAENTDNKEIESLGIDLSENKAKDRDKAINRIKSLGGEYNGFCIIGKAISHEENKARIYELLRKKLEKLNTREFKKFNENDLCIFSTIHDITQEEQDDFLEKIEEIQSKYQYKFDNIYILLLHRIYEIDTKENKINKREFTKEQQFKYAERANEIINKYN